jgi:hypothetical protein
MTKNKNKNQKASKRQIGGRHYKDFKIQPAEFIHKNKIGFLEGNVIKYVCRHSAKNGRIDLGKARHYIDLLLEWEYGPQTKIRKKRRRR